MSRAIKMLIPDVVRPLKWRIERAGSESGRLPGWFALSPEDSGAWFPTHAEALAFALAQVKRKSADDGLTHALARWGIERVEVTPINRREARDEEILRLHATGLSNVAIGQSVGVTGTTVGNVLRRHDLASTFARGGRKVS